MFCLPKTQADGHGFFILATAHEIEASQGNPQWNGADQAKSLNPAGRIAMHVQNNIGGDVHPPVLGVVDGELNFLALVLHVLVVADISAIFV